MTQIPKKYFKDILERNGIVASEAFVSHLPRQSSDGHDFGGGTILTIGDKSIFIGEGINDTALAYELAERWNNK